MVNLRKYLFRVPRAVVLGLEVSYATCALGEKYLKKWLSQHLPRSLSELQSIVGRLTWAGTFVPGFKEMIHPIELLLQRAESVWTECCTQALNRLVAVIFQRLQLGIADVTRPVTLHVGYT